MTESDRARHDNYGLEAGYVAELDARLPTAGWERGRVDSIVDNTFPKVPQGIRKIYALHTTPWFHATHLPNVPSRNLVQISIGGWQAPRPSVQVGRKRGATRIATRVIRDTLVPTGHLPKRPHA